MIVFEIVFWAIAALVCGGFILFLLILVVYAVVSSIKDKVRTYREKQFKEQCRRSQIQFKKNNPYMYKKLYGDKEP